MSDDRGTGRFTDGLTEDLITDLSRNAGLFVIARHSTFAYKGKSLDVRLIARDLGVRYVLEGSARRAAGRVRINVQLIDAVGGDHLWAERFDRSLEDIFAVQDEVTGKIVEALVGRLTAPPARNRPKSMEAYDLCVRARVLTEQSPQASREARLLSGTGDRARSGLCGGTSVARRHPLGRMGALGRADGAEPAHGRGDGAKRPWCSTPTTPATTVFLAIYWPTNGAGWNRMRIRGRARSWTRTMPMPGQCGRTFP